MTFYSWLRRRKSRRKTYTIILALLYLFGEVGIRIEVDRGMLSTEADENALIFRVGREASIVLVVDTIVWMNRTNTFDVDAELPYSLAI